MDSKNQTSSRFKRWTVLIIVAIVMMMGYVFWDIVSPLSTQLKAPIAEGGMNWTSAEYGFYAGSYSIFNIFLLMLFFGGIILDKCGIRFTGIMATGVMLLGSFINYYALTRISPNVCVDLNFTLFGLIPEHIKLQVLIAALGFGLFGMGCDITGITVSKVVTKWFKGHELASAMGIQVAMARLGTASALSFSPLIAMNFGLSAPILVGAFMLLIGFVLFLIYIFMDKDFDRNKRIVSLEANDESFRFRDFVKVLQNPGFWMIAILCVFFYSSIRPFMKFATDLLINKYGVEGVTAGWIVSALPYATIILTPLFGSIYDRIGKGATLMLIGCVLVTACHICLLLPFVTYTWFATVIMIILGIAFSLVPSAMWPSVPKIVPLKQLGTAYSIIYYIQNLGLMLVPMWVGDVIGQNTTSDGHVDFTMPMMIFVGFGIVAIFISSILLIMDKKKHYGLEDANIIK
jgi:nitrate/nitrite transporter NarK